MWILLLSLALNSAIAAPTPPQKAVVFGGPVVTQDLHDELHYPARIVAKIESTLLAETEGRVVKIQKPLGQRVAKGQVILTIQHTDPIYQYAPFQVRSPVSGVVSQLDISLGSQISRGQKLGQVIDPDQLIAKIEIPASEVTRLRAGSAGTFKLDSQNEVIPIQLRGLSASLDPVTGTSSGEIEFVDHSKSPESSAQKSLIPGMLGEVVFKINQRQGLMVSEDSIIYQGQKPLVRILRDGKTANIPVQLGSRLAGKVEITDGLSSGDWVVERASRFILEGEEVELQK